MKYSILISLILFLFSCSNEDQPGPADIKYGQDLCSACLMIISEKKYSAQYNLSDGGVKKFDDIGCMIEHLKQKKDERSKVSTVFVRDYSTDNWINANRAYFVKSDKITTPMGHGIISFYDKGDLKNFRLEIGGKHLGEFSDLN